MVPMQQPDGTFVMVKTVAQAVVVHNKDSAKAAQAQV
jgi:hypothetical protein